MAQLIEQFGGEGFANITDLLARTTMVNVSTTPPDLVSLNVFGVANEKWLATRDAAGSTARVVGRSFFPTINTTTNRREVEVSFAIYFDETPNGAAIVASLVTGSSIPARADDGVRIELQPSTTSGLTNELTVVLDANSNASTVGKTTKTGILAEAGKVFYCTIRTRGETTASSADGAYEVYINEALVDSSDPGHDWGSDSTQAQASIYLAGTNAADEGYIRNVSIWDGWSTTDGTAPTFKHVQDMVVTNATITGSFTNEGGAVDETTAVSDSDDTTYLASTVPGSEVVFTYTADPKVATYNVAEVFTRLRVARDSLALNDIEISLQDSGLPLVIETRPVTAIAPARENINVMLSTDGLPPVSSTTFEVKVVNGEPPPQPNPN